MQIVEVRRDAVAQPMAEMRDWLDAHHIEPKVFKLTIGTNCVVKGGTLFHKPLIGTCLAKPYSMRSLLSRNHSDSFLL